MNTTTKLKPRSPGQTVLAMLRDGYGDPVTKHGNGDAYRAHVQITSPVSRRSAKTNGRKTRVVKLRNWGITTPHFADESY